MENIITGKEIVKFYGKGKELTKALDSVSINIGKGEFIAVMGPSGCGKSTLFFALSGTDVIDGGTVNFNGTDLALLKENQLADFRRTKMGFVFQHPTMLKNLNLLDNIILPATQGTRGCSREITEKAKGLMERAEISGLEEREITEVSGGQLQRGGICRALIGTPEIIFADEPTGALNSKASEEVMNLFSDIHQAGTAIFLVTHDSKVAARAERVLFMLDGKIVSELDFSKAQENDMDCRIEQITSQMISVEIQHYKSI